MRFPGLAREPSPRRKIALLLVAAAALPLSATLWLAVRQTRALARKAAIDRLEARADQVADRLEVLDVEYRRSVRRLASAQDVAGWFESPDRRRAQPRMLERLLRFAGSDGDIRGLALCDLDGAVLATTEPRLRGLTPADRAYFQRARSGVISSSDIYLSEPGSVPSMAYAAPVLAAHGAVIGVAVLFVRAQEFWRVLREANGKAGEGSFSVLFDRHGIRIGSSQRADFLWRPIDRLDPALVSAMAAEARFGPDTRKLLESPLPFVDFEQARAGQRVFRREQSNGKVGAKLSLARRLKENHWTVICEVPESSVYAALGSSVPELVLAGALAVLAVVSVLVAVAARILAPGMAPGRDLRPPPGQQEEGLRPSA
jgi:C4-dicarboxylate-specific signal transduction histidine kinase